ncbi:4-hydroxyphenylacetate 3-hydroxylase N-terminal domain-containing protein [Sinomonas flava]|uniref:4-hydroxyphenylacetate 3-hydroxylase N-terminal domain-containing protein n=1 Tax=Sinomonas flava TaxID=496857 RepID=UPI0039A462C1
MTTPPIDPRDLRHAFGRFGTGVTVVTTRNDVGEAHGATVSAFTAVSLDPPLAQVTLMRESKLSGFVAQRPFAINIMGAAQQDTCLHFAGKPMRDGPAWGQSATGVPVLAGNAATLECRPWAVYDGGDHLIVVGEVVALEITPAAPLLFFGGKFHHLGGLVGGAPWTTAATATLPSPRSSPPSPRCRRLPLRLPRRRQQPQDTAPAHPRRGSAAVGHRKEPIMTEILDTPTAAPHTVPDMSERTTPANPLKPQTGDEYIESLRDGREVWIYGERVKDVTTHPAFRNSVRMVARLYDGFHDEATASKLLVPTDTGSGGLTHPFFKAARSIDDLKASRTAIETWARMSYGWLGRSPDYKGSFLGTLGGMPEYYEPSRRTPTAGTGSRRRRSSTGTTRS